MNPVEKRSAAIDAHQQHFAGEDAGQVEIGDQPIRFPQHRF